MPVSFVSIKIMNSFFYFIFINVTADRYLSVFLIKTLGSLLEFRTIVQCFAKNLLKISAFFLKINNVVIFLKNRWNTRDFFMV